MVLNPKYLPNKKNGGKTPPLEDERVKYVPISCQQCIECRKQKAREWQIRLSEDIKTNTNAKFATLTFSTEKLKAIKRLIEIKAKKLNKKKPEGYEIDHAIATYAMRHFLERYRKTYKRSIRHWAITELGNGRYEHLHIHTILWTNTNLQTIEKIWKYGYVWKGKETRTGKLLNYVNEATASYMTKYVYKTDEKHKCYKPQIFTSPGIGKQYTKTNPESKYNNFNGNNTNETYRTRQGYKLSLPIYYRNKIYTEQERERLWCYKLDKQERWILGTKIPIKTDEQLIQYDQALKYAQQQNAALGYGKPLKKEQIEHENNKRTLLYLNRLYNETKRLTPAGRRI